MLRWLSRVRRRLLPLPQELVHEHLGPNEKIRHSDSPSFRAYLFDNIWLFVLAIVAIGFFVVSARSGGRTTTGIIALIAILILFWLGLKRLGDHYTIYVLTNARVLKITGLLSRRVQSIPLGKVTDLSFKQSLLGRFFSYATVRIESANEESGLRDLSGVKDPIAFNKILVNTVVTTQGALPDEPATQPPPPPGAGWPDGGQTRPPSARRATAAPPSPGGPVHDEDTLRTRVRSWRDAIADRWRRWRSGSDTP